jgi:L-ascorbate metabolism protein UlaG (beta-lactamase superfamily)
MKVRWLGNSCVEIFGKKHWLIDPNFEVRPKSGVDYILITHEHKDHFDLKCYKSINAPLVAPQIILEEYKLEGIRARVGDGIDGAIVLESYCWKSEESYSYLVEGSVLHAGDSSKFPDVSPIVIFSACFPDKYKEYISEFKRINPKIVIPIHFSREKKQNAIGLGEECKKAGIQFKILEVGETLEV